MLWDTPIKTPASQIPGEIFDPKREYKIDRGFVLILRGDKIHAGAGYPGISSSPRLRLRGYVNSTSPDYAFDPSYFHTIESDQSFHGRVYSPVIISPQASDVV